MATSSGGSRRRRRAAEHPQERLSARGVLTESCSFHLCAEAFLALEPAIRKATPAPRGRAGEGSLDVPWDIAFLDAHEKRFPVLVPAAA